MKKLMLSIIGLAVAVSIHAQDSTVLKERLISFEQGVVTNHEIIVAVYPGFNPQLEVNGIKKNWGFGACGLYPLTDHTFTGIRVDYMGGQFWMPSATVGLRADFQIYGHNFSSFTTGGAIFPLSGAGQENGSIGAIVGAGVSTKVWQNAKGNMSIDAFVAVEKWTIFNGETIRPGVALNATF